MESISKSRIQGVWDPTHSTRTGIIAHSTRVGIPSGCRHFPPGCITSRILLPPPFHLDVHIRNFAAADIPPGCFTSGILTSDGRGERFNFPGQTYPDLLIALTRRASAADISAYPESIHGRHFRLPGFCAVPRCFPEASRYLRLTSLDIYI